jgi:hypothetical protein
MAIALAFALILGTFPASAARDHTPPIRPTNLRVTANTSFSVSLAWNPSTDNSGTFSYVFHASNGQNVPVSQTSTSFNWNFGLSAGYPYSFHVYAVDAAGNKLKNSNTVTIILPPDTIPTTGRTSGTGLHGRRTIRLCGQ